MPPMASDPGSGVGPEATVAVPLAEGTEPDVAAWEKATAAVLRDGRPACAGSFA